MDMPAPRQHKAVLVMVFALTLAALSAAFMKLLAETMSPPLISFFRFAGYFLLLLPLALFRHGWRVLRPRRPLVQIIRGLTLALGNMAFMYGVQYVDYANAIAIVYVYPFIMVSLSTWVLGESVSQKAWLGVFGGFCGVVLVMRPEVAGIDLNGLFIVFTGLMVAIQMLLNRKLGVMMDPVIVAVWGAFTATILSGFTLPFVWGMPTKSEMILIMGLALMTALSQTLMIFAMSLAPAGRIAPFTYVEIVAAVIIGLIMFGTVPDAISWIGMVLIVASGIMVKRMPGALRLRRGEKI
ncbi:DMT family transporter [Alphaproteobacteria bacterium LSUCC0684]